MDQEEQVLGVTTTPTCAGTAALQPRWAGTEGWVGHQGQEPRGQPGRWAGRRPIFWGPSVFSSEIGRSCDERLSPRLWAQRMGGQLCPTHPKVQGPSR